MSRTEDASWRVAGPLVGFCLAVAFRAAGFGLWQSVLGAMCVVLPFGVLYWVRLSRVVRP